MKKKSMLIIILFVVGCASSGNIQISQEEKLSKIKLGETTKTEVKALLGEPSYVSFTDTGVEQWMYYYTRVKTRGATFIPIVGAFAGGMDMDNYTLTILFTEEGVVKKYGKGHSTTQND